MSGFDCFKVTIRFGCGFNLLKNPFMCMQNGIEVQMKTRKNQIQI
jgi:hypothetical protein